MLQTIQINKIKLYANHGCLEEESLIGGQYEVDIEIITNFIEAAITDELDKTIDYVIVHQIVKEEMLIRSKLIEHVGYRILKRLQKEFGTIIKTKVKIIKVCPPINGDVENVAIIIEE